MPKHRRTHKLWTGLHSNACLVALGASTIMALLSATAIAQLADPERGRVLYENHCVACHTQRVHTRPNRIALTRAEVRAIVDHWQRQQNLIWSEQDTADVVEFLGRTQYKLAPSTDRLSKP